MFFLWRHVAHGGDGGLHPRDAAQDIIHIPIKLRDGFGRGEGLIFHQRLPRARRPDLRRPNHRPRAQNKRRGEGRAFQVHRRPAQGFADDPQKLGVAGDIGFRFSPEGAVAREFGRHFHFRVRMHGVVDG